MVGCDVTTALSEDVEKPGGGLLYEIDVESLGQELVLVIDPTQGAPEPAA